MSIHHKDTPVKGFTDKYLGDLEAEKAASSAQAPENPVSRDFQLYLETGDPRHAWNGLDGLHGPLGDEAVSHLLETSQEIPGKGAFAKRALHSLATRSDKKQIG